MTTTKRKYVRKAKIVDTTPVIDLTKAKNVGEMKDIIKKATQYTASIKVFGKTFTSKGKTVLEALENLDVGKLNKGTSVVTVSHNGSSQSKILPSVQTARLFSPSPMTRQIALKNISLRFYGV